MFNYYYYFTNVKKCNKIDHFHNKTQKKYKTSQTTIFHTTFPLIPGIELILIIEKEAKEKNLIKFETVHDQR